MGYWLDFAWLLFLLAATGWLVSALLARPLAPAVLRPGLAFRQRERHAVLLAALPWLVPLTIVVSVCAVAFAKQQGWVSDHCLHHAGIHHPHLCFAHLPAIGLNFLHGLTAAGAGLLFAGVAGRVASREWRMARSLQSLTRLARRRGRLTIVPDGQVFAWAAGLRHPAIVCSRGLLEALTPRQRRIVVAHEAEHLRHRDPLRKLLLETLLLLHFPGSRQALRRQWHQAAEERADARVARRFAPEAVADTLLRTAKLFPSGTRAALSIQGADLRGRIEALMRQPAAAESSRVLPAGCLYWLALALLALVVFTSHHTLETLLGLSLGL